MEININSFFKEFLPNNNKFWEYNKDTLYILRNANSSDIKEETKLVRGSSQKSHVISPIDYRLSTYLMLFFNMNSKKFMKNNAFLTKDRYLPSSKENFLTQG